MGILYLPACFITKLLTGFLLNSNLCYTICWVALSFKCEIFFFEYIHTDNKIQMNIINVSMKFNISVIIFASSKIYGSVPCGLRYSD
jgi:hypothetical protein